MSFFRFIVRVRAEVCICVCSSTGLKSRGRIGIDAAMTMQPIDDPWLTDKNDEAVLWQAVQDTFSTYKNGMFPPLTIISLHLT